jgi:hypothetical protein
MSAFRPAAFGGSKAFIQKGGSAPPLVGDPDYDKVMLLLHGDGANNGTVFTDNSPSAKSPSAVVGNVKTVTAQSVFGGSSIYFDGTGDRLEYAATKDWGVGSDDFTVEFHWRPDTANDNTLFVVNNDPYPSGQDFAFGIRHLGVTNAGKIQFYAYNGVNQIANINSTTGWTASTWKAIRIVHAGNMFGIMVDGILEASVSPTIQAVNFSSAMKLFIGMQGAATYQAKGWMDELRFTKGLARSTGDYTVDTQPFPNSL